MHPYTHGGDIVTAGSAFSGEILDFSANLNPLGMAPQVAEAARCAIDQAHRYPDPHCRALTMAQAVADGIDPEVLLWGNGAADLIFRLCFALRPKAALVTAPTFSEYEEALTAVSCAVRRHMLQREDNFDVTESILAAITPDLDLLFLCTPNNPTGRPIPTALMLRILDKCRQSQVRLVVDECFLTLCQDATGLEGQLTAHPHLLILRAYTKSHAMAGLRLGYALSADRALLLDMSRCAQPWSVSHVAQMAGLAALECPEWAARGVELVAKEKPKLVAGLEAQGFWVCPGKANYVLFQAPGCYDLKERLLAKGILIRSCANYPGLAADDYRVCVRTQEENQRLLAAIGEVL